MKKSFVSLLLLTSVLFTAFVSCSDDDDDIKLELSTDKVQSMLEGIIETVTIVRADGAWTAKSENQDIFTIEEKNDMNGVRYVRIIPVKVGKGTLTVSDAAKNTQQVAVRVVETHMVFLVNGYEGTLTVTDANAKAAIESDLKKEVPQLNSVFTLVKNEAKTAYFFATNDDAIAGKKYQSGVYEFNEVDKQPYLRIDQVAGKPHNNHILGSAAAKQYVFSMFKPEWLLQPAQRATAPQVILMQMEADLTTTYAERYPNAGVTSVVVKIQSSFGDQGLYTFPE